MPKAEPSKATANQKVQAWATLIVLGFVIAFIGRCAMAPAVGPSKQDLADARKAGFHCLSKWSGENASASDAIRATLRDPDSLKIVSTRISPVNAKGKHLVFIDYRARNGFGGMNSGKAVAEVDQGSCKATLISSVDQ